MRNQKLRCYYGNLDGTREGMVIAANQKEAADTAHTSVYSFRQFWHEGKLPEGQAHCIECGCRYSFQRGRLYTRMDQFRLGVGPDWYIGMVK